MSQMDWSQKTRLSKDKLQQTAHNFATKRSLCGFTLEIRDDQEIIWRDSSDPQLQGAVFPIYSITKSFIGALILKAAEENLLALREPLSSFAFGMPSWLEEATVWQLLCHRSGLGDYGYEKTYQEGVLKHSQKPFSIEELKNIVFSQGPQGKPDEKFLYSNVGYRILVEILEQRYKADFSKILNEKICLPMGLPETSLMTESLQGVHAGFSKIWSRDFQDMRSIYHPAWVAHGLIASTVADLNNFLRGLFTGKILSKESLKLIHNPYPVNHSHFWFKTASYGPGFMGDAPSKEEAINGHNGGGPGYDTSAFCWESGSADRLYISVIVNQDGAGLAEQILFGLIETIKS